MARDIDKLRDNVKNHYLKHKKKILSRRRERYKNDPEYRKKIRERQKEHYHSENKREVPVDRTVIQTTDGRTYYSIRHLAERLDLPIDLVRRYHERGIIPDGVFDSRGWRLYSAGQIDLIAEAFSRFSNVNNIKFYLKKHWEDEHGSKKG